MLISTKSSEKLGKHIISSKETFCSGLFLSARWFVLSRAAVSGTHLIVLPDKESAEYCTADLYNLTEGDAVFFLPDSGKSVERSNYKSSLGVQRTSAIGRILSGAGSGEPLYVVTYPEALEELVPERKRLDEALLKIRKGDELSHEKIKEILAGMGFCRTDFVSAPGQYAIRGSLIDIFSYSFNNPYRISFWGNEVDRISIFNCNTQLSVGETDGADIYPDIAAGGSGSSGVSISSLLPADTVVWLDSADMYMDREFYSSLRGFRKVFLEIPLSMKTDDAVSFSISPQPSFNKNFDMLSKDIGNRLDNGYKVFVYGEKEAQLQKLESILSQCGKSMPEFVKGKNIHEGFIDNEDKICCYTDHEILDRFHRVFIRRAVEKSERLTANDLSAFNIGDYVVHIDYGVGIFGGLVRMKDDMGRMKEAVKLTYKDGDVVFLSVHSLNKISRFRSKEGEAPKINKLGSKTWQNLKNSAKSKVKDIARDLIKLYAVRKASKGYAFSPDSYLQEELESSFMYEDTPDQEKATKAVKLDMEAQYPMDRLICGDVGFGKTEIAVRASFKAVSDGKQVAILVPTTILALQHYDTFSARLKDFPCTVDYVSRLRTAKEISSVKENLRNGKIDILIGTHKILGKDFEFKDLGLLIIDEEQKFGVSAKEKLRTMKESVDTLTLTATPIPRTLQFSLLGARDLSIINTPPPNRIPIQTEIILFDEKEIKGIIEYELNRGGQIFFLHNKVDQLDSIREILRRLVPDMRICVAHGQMESKELENRMLDFIRGEYDMLLCTTIIENGLDIPNANTIIINQAQNIGLGDLHQLRGRVGRSNRKAFCYLIVPPLATVTDEARRRLKAVEEFSDLGSGFNIAMQDLDIRGAGNLLGAEQSGFISDMGLETYQKILSEAMEEIGVETGTFDPAAEDRYSSDCIIDTDRPAFIPDGYIDVNPEKIRIYKQLDSMSDEESIDLLAGRLEDRFGPLPEEVENLLYVVKIRNAGARLGFEKIIIKNGMLIMFFISDPSSKYYASGTFERILKAVGESGSGLNLKQKDGKLRIVTKNIDSMDKAYGILQELS